MKIIALLPEKNESWILPTYLSSIKKIADEVIAIDDGSTDNSKQILKDAGAFVYDNKEIVKSGWAEHSIRQKLLQLGREHGGTHFICLDADEALSTNFLKHGRNIIEKLKPGQKISMQWIFLWKNTYQFLDDKRSLFKDNYKDFIFCDKPNLKHDYTFMHVGRTPGENKHENLIKINNNEGVCLHFTFVNWKNFMLKQAWVRCSDLIEKQESYAKINNRYYNPAEKKQYKLTTTPIEWLNGLDLPKNVEDLPLDWHLPALFKFFDIYGIKFFEPLEIWDIKELENEFIKRIGRKPKSSKLHIYLQPAIKIKRKINKFL